ncbi:ABC transporter permease [Candidatus Bipolaricaulota bacterium]
MREPRIVFGSIFLLFLCGVAIFAPYLVPYDPLEVFVGEPLERPSASHLFGTDNLGRDVFSRVVLGTRYSLVLGLLAIAISGSLGIILGLIAGYAGGKIDAIIMRVVDVGLAFPSVLLALLVISVIGPGLTSIVIAIGVSSTPPFIRIVRGSVLVIKEMTFIEAARSIGVGQARIILRHILPEVFAPALTMATLGLANAIFSASSLSFLGFGARPPTPEWGVLVSSARHQLRAAWWISTFSGLAIMISVLSINVLGDGLRDILDPKLRGKM